MEKKELFDLGGRSDLWNSKMVLENIEDGFNDESLNLDEWYFMYYYCCYYFGVGYVDNHKYVCQISLMFCSS